MKRWLLVLAALIGVPLALGAGVAACVAVQVPPAPRLVAAPVAQPMDAAAAALRADDPLLAIAYASQIRPHDREYDRAQRLIGHEILTRRLDRPVEGLAATIRAVRKDPGSGNAWQDFGRTLGAALRER